MAERFTFTQLRIGTKKLHSDMPAERRRLWIAKGLLPDPEEELWTEATVMPRVVRVLELGREEEPSASSRSERASLDRRVVQLYVERFPVPPRKLQLAMAGMMTSIQQPARKMRAMREAVLRLSHDKPPAFAPKRGTTLPKTWTPPPASEWRALLRDADPEHFAAVIKHKEYLLAVLKSPLLGLDDAIAFIPLAEQLTLLMVLDIAAWEGLQELGGKSPAKDREQE